MIIMTRAALQAACTSPAMQRQLRHASAKSSIIKCLITRSEQPGRDTQPAAPPCGSNTPTDLSPPTPRIIKCLIIDLAATSPTPSSAHHRQVHETSSGVSMLSPRVIKRLIIWLQGAPNCSRIEAESDASEHVSGGGSLVGPLRLPASAHFGLLAQPSSCFIKRLIIDLPGGGKHAPGLRTPCSNAEWSDASHAIKHLIPPGSLLTSTPRSLTSFPTTEPCRAGFSRFWGATLQKRRL